MKLQSRETSTCAARARRREMRERRLTAAMSMALAGLALLACKQGERAGARGQCPAGETCSALTPGGLGFAGANTVNEAGKDKLLPTAIGGTQTVTAYYANPPLVLYVAGFDAKLVDSRIATLESPGPTSLVLRGVSEGKALLRLLEPGTNKLLDRTEITTAAVARVSLIPRELWYEGVGLPAEQWAILANNPAEIGVMLFDADNNQVIDESLDLQTHGAEVARRAWDRFEIRAAATDSLSIVVRAGGHPLGASAQVVSSIDDIVKDRPTSEGATPLKLKVGGTRTAFCFLAKSASTTVVGAQWTFEPSESVTITSPEPPSDTPPWEAPPFTRPSCVTLTGRLAGRATLKVTADYYNRTFDINISE